MVQRRLESARFKRLPDWLTLPAAVASLLFFEPAGLIWPGIYLALACWRGGVGGGDIKLAFPLGMWVTHECGVMGQLLAMMGASLSTAVWGTLRKDSAPPHGPGMLIAAALCVIAL
ncbi:prepilin peptidase [Corynebacterium striatum]